MKHDGTQPLVSVRRKVRRGPFAATSTTYWVAMDETGRWLRLFTRNLEREVI